MSDHVAPPNGRGKGRKLGGPQKATVNIRLLARKHGAAAIEVLAKIMLDEKVESRSRVAAAKEILDRGYGRATLYVEMPENEDIIARITAADEFARRIAKLATGRTEGQLDNGGSS